MTIGHAPIRPRSDYQPQRVGIGRAGWRQRKDWVPAKLDDQARRAVPTCSCGAVTRRVDITVRECPACGRRWRAKARAEPLVGSMAMNLSVVCWELWEVTT